MSASSAARPFQKGEKIFRLASGIRKVIASLKAFAPKSFDKVGCVFPMIIISILSHAEFEPKDNREDAALLSVVC